MKKWFEKNFDDVSTACILILLSEFAIMIFLIFVEYFKEYSTK